MGQAEVLKFLEKSKKWMTISEIMKELNQSRPAIDIALRKMYKHKEVLRKEKEHWRKRYLWKAKKK